MYAMQYEITLPADYDMQVIRRRVAAKAPALDNLPGLGLKAYLIRERGVDGSPVNQYAPFYLWASIEGMGGFLWGGDGFGGVVGSFGRPPVRHWTGVACLAGPDRGGAPSHATRHTEPLPADADPANLVAEAVMELRGHARRPGIHTAALAVDPWSWELVRFTLWTDPAPAENAPLYQVLHLSTPQLRDITRAA
ncbi:DUF4865 family protein [Inquilinus limosus]|uniref:D-amino acid aminotransferase n=1 Tax=Inquilinus limosus MP06 TaxID=1398085 RepID=A0A0A0DDU2_9PROT|nr:DUF4865 family protein [Inquilinus limosus]KGM35172.1 hypothetical protein P409_06040 [Inquilinus limosus MP06]